MFAQSTSRRFMDTAAEQATTGGERVLEAFREMPSAAYLAALGASIVASLALMVARRERTKHWGLFLGLWAPTILNLGLYSRLRR
jgi:hypothetical protein